jgi:hypothetical protein
LITILKTLKLCSVFPPANVHSINIPKRSDIIGPMVNMKCDGSFLRFN